MKLSDWLEQSGTTQADLARALAVSQGRISQLVAGGLPSLDLALKLKSHTRGAMRPEDFSDMPNSKIGIAHV